MSGHQNISEQFLSAREKSLQKKVVHLETQLQVYRSQIHILHEEHKKLEERVLTTESALTKTKKELFETKKEVLDKELAEIQLSEELKSMTLQAEEYKRLFVAERNKNTCGLDRLEALISNVDAEMQNEDVPNRFESFKDLISVIQEGFQAQIKMILDKLSDAEDVLYRSSPYTEGKVQQTKINKETPSNGSMFELANLSDKVKGEVDDEPRVKAANPLPEKIQAVTNSSEACKHEQFSCNSTNGEDSVDSEPTPVVQFQQTQQSFVPAQANFKHAHPNDTIDLHPFMSKRPIKGATKQDQDCILIHESRTPIVDREMASRLFLPPNFYNYTKRAPCPGCIGCRVIPKIAADTIKQEAKDIKQVSTSATLAVFTSTATSHVFGQSANFGQLTFSSFKAQDGIAFSQSQTKASHKPFPGAGRRLFAEPAEEVEGQDSDKLHFELVIPLPEEIQVVTGEEENKKNTAEDSSCVASNSLKPNDGETEPPSKHREETATANVCAVDSVEPKTFQNLNKEASTSFFFQPLGGKGLDTSKLFTIGRGESSVDKDTTDDEIDLSPSKTSSPSKKGIITPQPSTQDSHGSLLTGFLFGTGAPYDFTFRMTVWSGSAPQKPRSPLSRSFPTSPVLGDADGKSNFEPVIPLPEEIQVVTGEEGLEVMFSERAKLYRFDVGSLQWKKRGIGEVKLLRHPTSGRGRVLMRREQIKKLCANHNITAEMELKPNVGSDRSWVWYTSADYSEGEGKPEKLAIKFKTAETAGNFKQVFDELKELFSSGHLSEKATAENQKAAGCELYKQCLSNFAPAPGTWSSEVCYVENKAADPVCVASNSLKPNDGETEPPSKHGEETATANVCAVDSVEPKTFQNLNKEASTSFFFQPLGGKGLDTSKLFTIGRGESSVDKDTTDDEIDLSPSNTFSPSKKRIITPQPSTQDSQGTLLTGLPFGTGAPCNFTFRMTVSPGSPPQKPRSPLSHSTPTSPVRGDDDGPYFEPLIPLPDKVECRTGEEGQEVLFCDRCKLFRYDSDTSQWKERGVGDIKILLNPSSKRHRILMRREHVFKICANHVITSEMQLKPFPKSERAWLWTTLGDFSEESTTAETLAVRFKCNEVANNFKEVFDKALQTLSHKSDHWVSSSNPKDNNLDKAIVKQDHKERDVFGYEEEAFSQPGISASGEGQSTEILEVTTSAPSVPSQSGFLFGSASVASLSFQCVAASSLTASPFGKKTPDKSPGLKGAGHGSQLFANTKTKDDSEEVEADGNHPDGPHFEPIIPLPDKIDVKTGEEDEEVMFSHRAKLYRFVAEEKQWKERGIGDIKLLRNARSGKMRVLMRRDQVLKLCANHQITTDMNLQPNAGSDRSWVWSTHADFSEGECKAERLAVRFKNEDIARQFKEKFEECQEMLKNQASLILPLQKETVNKEGVKEDLLAKFKAEEGSWECDTCMVRNGIDKLVCTACTSPKPGITDSQEKKSEGKPIFGSGSTSSGTGFTFGSGASSSGTGFSFGSGATLCRKGFVFGSSGTNKGGAKPFFSFGSSNLTPSSSSETLTTFGSMTQLKTTVQEHVSGEYTDVSQTDQQTPDVDNKQPRNGEKNNVLTADTDAVEGERVEMTSFGESETPPNNKNDDSSEEKAFLFGSPSISGMSFQSVAASSIENSPFGQNTKAKSKGFVGARSTLFASESPGGEPQEKEEQEGDHDGPHFNPIISVTEKIDVKTGKKDDEVMFSHRAKLYRFIAEEKQWKERGIGDIKLLRNVRSGKMRVVMLRDHVLQLCANHQITTDMSLQPNAGSDRSWVWTTNADFSEGECKAERLAVRFKNGDIAKQFKEKFEECQEMLKNQASLKPPVQRETVNTEGVKEDLLAKFKGEEVSWECDTCMVRNSSDKLVCAACTNPKPGAQTSQMSAYRGTPSLSSDTAGASSNSGFSLGSTTSSVDAGSGFASASGQGFSFGSDSSSSGTGFVFGQQKADGKSSKPVFSFGLGSNGPFSFGSTQKEENTVVRVDDEGEGGNYSDDQATSDEGSNCGDDSLQTSEEGEVTVGGVEGEKRQEGLGTGLLGGWKPEEGSWECNTCLVRNKSEKLECVACASPKPGVVVNGKKTTEGKPLFGFGSGSSFSNAGFSFGTSTSSSGAGFSFGSGPTSTGAAFSFGFNGQSGDGEEREG